MHNKNKAFTSACNPEGAIPLSHPGCEALLAGTFGSTYANELAGGIFDDKQITQLRGEIAALDLETFPGPLVERFQPIDVHKINSEVE
jgi:hypothetical protein